MRIIIAKNYEDLSKKSSHIIAGQLIMKPDSVIGLATGSTPIGTYKVLKQMYHDDLISFSGVTTFNLDEYIGLDEHSDQSYRYFMNKELFDEVDIKPERVHIPSGAAETILDECIHYEASIRKAGGIDLQLLGIGRNGHIGFNEPDLKFEASTHLVALDEDTIKANARFFNSEDEVPKMAISMGIKTIMHSRRILLLASGIEKAEMIYQMVYGDIHPELPASVLQIHPDVIVILDEAAASEILKHEAADQNYIHIE